jgi:hypothetical protein
VVACLVVALPALGAAPDRGVRFDSPQVLDLAVVPEKFAGEVLPVAALLVTEADSMLQAASSEWLSDIEDPSNCAAAQDCGGGTEPEAVAAEASHVERVGPRLRIVPAQGDPVMFVDWSQPATSEADGDEEGHIYRGRLPGSGYHRVVVEFGHDAPGSFLVNPANGRIAFVHEGADAVVPAPDGLHLVTFNADNPPLSLRVAALDASGPTLELSCVAQATEPRAEPALLGWRDARSFGLTVDFGDDEREILRFSREGAAWSVAASDPARLAAIGFECRQAD